MAQSKADISVEIWFLVITIIVAVLVIGLTLRTYINNQRSQLKTLARDNLTSIANLKVNQIENWLSERRSNAEMIYDNSIFVDPLLAWLGNKKSPVLKKEIENWLASLCGDIGYSSISLVDPQGRTTIDYWKSGELSLEHEQTEIAEAMRENKIIEGELHQDTKGNISLDFFVPVRNHNQPAAGALVLRVNPQLFLYPMIQTWPVPSQSAETLLVRREGDNIVFLNELRHKKGTAFKLRFPVNTPNLPDALVVLGSPGLIEGKDYRGVPVLAVGKPIPGTDWFIVAKVDSSEIYLPMFWIGLRAATFGALIVILLGAGFYLVISRLSATALRASEIRYRRLFEAAKDGILILNANTGMIVDANPYLIKLLGFSLEQFRGKKIWEIGPLKDIFNNREKFLELQQKEFVRYEDLPLETADGRQINVEFVSNVYLIDRRKVVQCNIRDITERKLVEAKLALQNYHLQRSQELALVGSWDLDMKNNVLMWTDETYRIFGVPGGTPLTYEKFMGFIHPDDQARVAKAWQAAIAGKPFDVEHRIIVNGQIKWIREKAELQYLEQGKPVRAVGAVQDITDYKRLVNIRDEFVNTVSHELRTPMAIIHEGVAQVLEGFHGPINAEQTKFLSTTLKSIDRLGRIINNLLDISRLESGRMKAKKEAIDFAKLARETAAAFHLQAEKKGLEFVESIPAEPLIIYADRDEMIEVLTNLLGNAIKFTEQGRIEIAVIDKGDELEGFVADTGRGIAAENLPKIFEKFMQFGRIAGGGEKGTGLGLVIAKSLIELHNGKLWVESQENVGSKFIFILPKNIFNAEAQ